MRAAPVLFIACRWPQPGQAKTGPNPNYGGERERFNDAFVGDLVAVDQGPGDLSDRLARVPAPAFVVGSDRPRITAGILREAGHILSREDAVIGPASDSGYRLIGYNAPAPFAFAGCSPAPPSADPISPLPRPNRVADTSPVTTSPTGTGVPSLLRMS